jgi:hypothetical protein
MNGAELTVAVKTKTELEWPCYASLVSYSGDSITISKNNLT